GNGMVNAFDPITGAFRGSLLNTDGTPITIDGLWALQFGNDAAAGPANRLFFTAGPNDESNGLFGAISLAVSEPATGLLFAIGALAAAGSRRRLAWPGTTGGCNSSG